jgi:glycosyltransferase involved in cell wall biosynthesis
MKRILVLYKELAGYFMACLDELCETHGVEADVVAYPVNTDAPFQFNHSSRIRIISRTNVTDAELVQMVSNTNYQLIFIGGWFDSGYLNAVKHKKCNAVLGFDNAWNGSPKQILSALYGNVFIRPLFDYAFVPGSKQAVFAKRLGFAENRIFRGAYSCDVARFSSVQPTHQLKKRLIYTGRYSPEKFVVPLFDVFHELAETNFPDWELHCIGTGTLWEKRLESPHIIHHGFMQPSELLQLMSTGSAFVLPSTFEPWGVVVHEFAAAGYPMVLSSAVGASEAFLHPGENGFLFQSTNTAELKNCLSQLMALAPNELNSMGKVSRVLSQRITPQTWAAQLAGIMH